MEEEEEEEEEAQAEGEGAGEKRGPARFVAMTRHIRMSDARGARYRDCFVGTVFLYLPFFFF